MEEEFQWWVEILPRVQGVERGKVELFVSSFERAITSDGRLPLLVWLEIAWYVISHDPYQRRVPKWLVAAWSCQVVLSPLGRELSMMIGGIHGVAFGLCVVLLPAMILLYCIVCFYRSWRYQATRWALMYGEG